MTYIIYLDGLKQDATNRLIVLSYLGMIGYQTVFTNIDPMLKAEKVCNFPLGTFAKTHNGRDTCRKGKHTHTLELQEYAYIDRLDKCLLQTVPKH